LLFTTDCGIIPGLFKGRKTMQSWHSVFLGLRELPKEISEFDLQSFFTFTNTERAAIENRRQPLHRLGLALHIGFLRMCGRPLDAFRIIPAALWRHLGAQCGVGAPDIASLRSLYSRGRTLYDHQQLACRLLGFTWMTEHQRRYFVRVLRDELVRTSERNRLLAFVRGWLYERHVIIPHTRLLRRMIAAAVRQFEEELKTSIVAKVPPNVLSDWRATPGRTLESGVLVQSWLSEAPPKHSSPQIMEMLKRIEFLCSLDVHRHLTDISDALIRRYGYRLALRAPAAGTRIQEPSRTIEIACFLRYCLLNATDQLVLMLRRRVADLWREASGAKSGVDWANLYKQLINELRMLATRTDIADHEAREQLIAILADHSKRKPPSRAHLKREHLVENIRSVRTLLVALVELPWKSDGEHPVIQAMDQLRALYNDNTRILPRGISIELGSVWRPMFDGDDRDRAHRALEVATLLAFRRALRNGSVWIEHSFTFRSRSRLFISKDRWTAERTKHYTRLALPQSPKKFLDPLLDRVRTGLNQVAQAVQEGRIRIDEDIHLHALVAEAEDIEVKKLRTAFDQEIGDVQLPDLMLMVDAQVRFSWIMLGHEPRSPEELLMVYAGILAHGTSMSAAETARMIPQLSASNVRQAMHWAGDRPRLANAASAVFEFMHKHPIAETWGWPNLASSDMMSLETTRRVWQARLDPRRRTPSIGIYTHVHDRWGIFYAQPIVLNERQAGAAIEGVIRQDRIETTQLAVDTHGYTDFSMTLARLLGFDLCPCLRELKQRKLYVGAFCTSPEKWEYDP
jgi:hypothetical protein